MKRTSTPKIFTQVYRVFLFFLLSLSYGEGLLLLEKGSLPLLIVVPHGGEFVLEDKPLLPENHQGDRGTLETGEILKDYLIEISIGKPYLAINRVKSNQLNLARNPQEATGNDSTLLQSYEEFHTFLAEARAEILADHGFGLYLEIHSNGHEEAWNEVGLGIKPEALNEGDSSIQAALPYSTIHGYAQRVDFTWSLLQEYIQGPTSLGGLLEQKGFKSVPSPTHPSPGDGGFFYSGYNPWIYGSQKECAMDAIHLECSYLFVNQGDSRRERFGEALAESLLEFLRHHYGKNYWKQNTPIKRIPITSPPSEEGIFDAKGRIGTSATPHFTP